MFAEATATQFAGFIVATLLTAVVMAIVLVMMATTINGLRRDKTRLSRKLEDAEADKKRHIGDILFLKDEVARLKKENAYLKDGAKTDLPLG